VKEAAEVLISEIQSRRSDKITDEEEVIAQVSEFAVQLWKQRQLPTKRKANNSNGCPQ
jgi:hypothetical protein